MATLDDVRRIALSLPGAEEPRGNGTFVVDGRAFAWRWLERIDPRRGRVPSDGVVGVRVAHEDEKAALIDLDPDVFFTEPHYDGYPAILVRLAPIDLGLLETVLRDGWRTRASKRRLSAPNDRTP